MSIKWIQLDLARQMENIDTIENFIKIMAEAGYNGILLYLEDRIRTASYPYPKDNECYTEEQMRQLVDYAAKLGMEIVPCVATLGHAERFLRHPELAHLSEVRDGIKERFGGNRKDEFCPTEPEFYPFMERYLTEVAALFPSKYFHAGLDEFFNYCLCPRCKAAAPDYESQRKMFVDHVIKIHDILAKLGKRMAMWSDMFEIYREAIYEVPNDILMFDWQYQEDVRFYLAHLFDCTVEDRFATNEKLGIDCVIAPAEFHLSNMTSSLKFAEGQKCCKGYVLTNWEKSDAFLLRYLPQYVFTGLLINGMPENEAYAEMVRRLFGTDDAILRTTLKLIYTQGLWRHFNSVSEGKLFTRDFFGLPYPSQEIDIAAFNIISEKLPQIKTDLGKRIIEDLLYAVREKIISHKLKKLYQDALDGHPAEFDKIEALHKELLQLIETLEKKWDVNRPGITPNVFSNKLPIIKAQLEKQLDNLRNCAFMKLRICAPDGYGIQHTRISLRKDGKWTMVTDRVLKPNGVNIALAECFLPVPKELVGADALKIESYGMGGVGICWAELGKAQPKAILSADGIVEHPEHLLDNDVKFAWFGSQSTREDYLNASRAETIHSVILSLT
ncbi:MAG: family 20 glycosylhydrolase [Victivallales bacterium]|nr:family 20 glycosylhydrolase [Victivallales bacterium]